MKPLALITGGQQGIGFGIAQALADAGYALALAAQYPEDEPVVREALNQLGDDARYHQHDVQAVSEVGALVDRIEGSQGPLTTFVSNAGVSSKVRGDLLEMTVESFDFVHGVNLRGAFFLAQEVARRMTTRSSDDYRSLLFVTSVNASMVSVERAEYCISKAGAAMMASAFAVRLAPHGIGVFELRPGIIETSMTEIVKDKYTPRIEDGLVPVGRWGQPADIGAVVLPLVEGRMKFATGTTIPVDGGLSIPRL
jgi:NAD(P)-dependent dehydrogenase (short-subunit alcohol dehydrogenase family)